MLLHQRVVWDQALHWGEKEKKSVRTKKKKGNLRGNLGRGEDGGAWRHAFDSPLPSSNKPVIEMATRQVFITDVRRSLKFSVRDIMLVYVASYIKCIRGNIAMGRVHIPRRKIV